MNVSITRVRPLIRLALAVALAAGVVIPVQAEITWTNYTTGNGLGSNHVEGIYADGGTIYAATRGGVSVSTNNGTSWTNYTMGDGLGSNWVLDVYAAGGTIYAATGDWPGSVGGLSIGASAVPEIDPAGFGSVAALVTGALGLIERRRLKAKAA